jgi:hypothetical protein
MKVKTTKAGFGMFELGVLVAGAGAVWYLWFKDRPKNDGVNLWTALGFPYGPIGNLSSIGADFKTGKKALPIYRVLDVTSSHILTDTLGVALTDTVSAVLTDTSGAPVITVFPSRNATGLRDSFPHSGTKPS